MKIITGNAERIYVNTATGCEGKCRYCYLAQLGMKKLQRFTIEEVLKEFHKCTYFKEGPQGTIISIGCYSECLDEGNKLQTIKLLRYFLEYSNYIQLATKQSFSFEDFEEIDKNLKYEGQLHVYVSMPTISSAVQIEPNCANIEKRIHNFEEAAKFRHIKVHLYIKPVLQDVTMNDLEMYKEIIQRYNVSCVVGEMLYLDQQRKKMVQVGDDFFGEDETLEAMKLRSKLSTCGEIFKNSIDIIAQLRGQ